MRITRKYEIDMGHRIKKHGGKCKHLHGHRYVIEATIEGGVVKEGPGEGMVVDFGNVKAIMAEVLDNYDHSLCLQKDDPLAQMLRGMVPVIMLDEPPTAETLARIWAEAISQRITGLVRLVVYETPNCWAEWVRDEENSDR